MPRPDNLPPGQPCTIGEMRHRCTFGFKRSSQGAGGERVRLLEESDQIHVAIFPLGQQFLFDDQNVSADISHVAYIHHRREAYAYARLFQPQVINGEVEILDYEVKSASDYGGYTRFIRFDLKLVGKRR